MIIIVCLEIVRFATKSVKYSHIPFMMIIHPPHKYKSQWSKSKMEFTMHIHVLNTVRPKIINYIEIPITIDWKSLFHHSLSIASLSLLNIFHYDFFFRIITFPAMIVWQISLTHGHHAISNSTFFDYICKTKLFR